jgi:putative addiction module killer protein
MRLIEYLNVDGASPFGIWFDDLDAPAAVKVTTSLTRLSLGNVSNVKSVGAGVQELKVDFGKGYRVYFGKDGEQLVVLLAGGTKQRQQRDTEDAKLRWQAYKDRKKKGER